MGPYVTVDLNAFLFIESGTFQKFQVKAYNFILILWDNSHLKNSKNSVIIYTPPCQLKPVRDFLLWKLPFKLKHLLDVGYVIFLVSLI